MTTASKLSDTSGVPHIKIYDTLLPLESKGFVVTIPGESIRYRATHPKQVLDGVKKLMLREYVRKLRDLEMASRELQTI